MRGVSSLSADQTHAILDLFRADVEALERSFPGEQAARQPVHTVYGGAHLFKRDIASKFGRLALASLAEYAPDAESLREAMGLAGDLAHAQRVRDRVVRKLADQPLEDFRIDFEDGYGHRPEAEEDAHAEASARELALGAREGVLPAFIGLRIKALSREAGARALRTLDRFITTLANELGGSLPPGFVVTLPKVQSASQVAALRVALELLEGALGIDAGTIGVELMVEQTQALFGPDGRLALPGLKDAAQGRLRAAHLGAYVTDVVYYSDDGGATWTVGGARLNKMDEAVVAALGDGSLLLNMRNDHLTACKCRAVARSTDGGASFSSVSFDSTLVSPVCQASMAVVGTAQSLFFSNPASTSGRFNITVRRSDDGGASWRPQTFLANAGQSAGYSCLAAGGATAVDAASGREFGSILYESMGASGSVASVSFRLFPLDLAP